MSALVSQHVAALRGALRRFFTSPLNTFLSLLVIGIALALPCAGWVAIENLRTLAGNTSSAQQISIFMDVDAGKKDVAEIESRLREAAPNEWQFVAREDALKRLQSAEGMAEIIASLPKNPLPDAFVVEPAETQPEALEALARNFASWPKVAHVQLDSAWVKRFDAFLRIGKLAVTLIAGVFAAALVAATFNTIRLQIMAQAAEIEVTRFVGATDAFIRRPFQYFGALQGCCGGLLAAALVHVGVLLLTIPVGELVSLYSGDFVLRGLSPANIATLTAVGAALGWLGAQLSVSIHLRRLG
jgi:cell division transport system permease protein